MAGNPYLTMRTESEQASRRVISCHLWIEGRLHLTSLSAKRRSVWFPTPTALSGSSAMPLAVLIKFAPILEAALPRTLDEAPMRPASCPANPVEAGNP
jgi:hypothetical protein